MGKGEGRGMRVCIGFLATLDSHVRSETPPVPLPAPVPD